MENLEKEKTLLVIILDSDSKNSQIECNFSKHFIYIPKRCKLSALDEMYSNLIFNISKNKIENLIIDSNNKYVNDILIYCNKLNINIYKYYNFNKKINQIKYMEK